MIYLIGQMLLCLLAAAFLGFLLGWFLRGIGCREQIEALRAELDGVTTRARWWETQAREWESKAGAATGSRSSSDRRGAVTADPEVGPEGGGSTPGPRSAYVPSFPVEEIEGIGAGFGRRLGALGVTSTAQLLRESATGEGKARLAEACGVEVATVESWVTMADLLRIPGVGGQWAELLWRSGVHDVEGLGKETAAPLLLRMTETNEAEGRVPELPSLERVEHWIGEAEAMSGASPGDGPYVPGFPIEEIEGIGAGFGRRLRAKSVRTTVDLLALGRSPETLERLAELCAVPAKTVGSWFTMADLLRIPGVGGQWAELLWRSGIAGVEGLATQEADELLEVMEGVNARERRVPELPELDRVRFWIAEAGRMVGAKG
jgi:predicted flap endonuclease-1-like 5' DNA nuclease